MFISVPVGYDVMFSVTTDCVGFPVGVGRPGS